MVSFPLYARQTFHCSGRVGDSRKIVRQRAPTLRNSDTLMRCPEGPQTTQLSHSPRVLRTAGVGAGPDVALPGSFAARWAPERRRPDASPVLLPKKTNIELVALRRWRRETSVDVFYLVAATPSWIWAASKSFGFETGSLPDRPFFVMRAKAATPAASAVGPSPGPPLPACAGTSFAG